MAASDPDQLVLAEVMDLWRALRAENERLREALERIAKQGGGRWDGSRMMTVGFTGHEWVHWEALAQRALASDERGGSHADAR